MVRGRGDNVGYCALHEWVRKRLSQNPCESCGSTSYDLANISQEYKRDLTDWEWLCRKCHMLKDGRMDNLRRGLNVRHVPTVQER